MQYNKFFHPDAVKLRIIKKRIKHNETYLGYDDFDDVLADILNRGIYSKEPLVSPDNISRLLMYLHFKKQLLHYFLETEELEEFLGTTRITDTSAVRQMVSLDEMAINRLVQVRYKHGEVRGVRFSAGVIHSPSNHDAISFIVYRDEKDELFTLGAGIGNYYAIPGQINQDWTLEKVVPQLEKRENYWVSVVINMFLYMKAFPGSVLDKAPKGEPIEYSGTPCKTIVTENSIIDHGGKSPHFRRGHFRLLSSERFTKKRGQIVFVRSSFVGGHAKTVLENSEVVT